MSDDVFARLAKGLCARCGNEPVVEGITWGKRCDMWFVNGMRLKRGAAPLTSEEYDLIGKG